MEEGGANPPLQPGNRLRNRRFGEAKLNGRTRKGAALSDLGEDRPRFEIRPISETLGFYRFFF